MSGFSKAFLVRSSDEEKICKIFSSNHSLNNLNTNETNDFSLNLWMNKYNKPFFN